MHSDSLPECWDGLKRAESIRFVRSQERLFRMVIHSVAMHERVSIRGVVPESHRPIQSNACEFCPSGRRFRKSQDLVTDMIFGDVL